MPTFASEVSTATEWWTTKTPHLKDTQDTTGTVMVPPLAEAAHAFGSFLESQGCLKDEIEKAHGPFDDVTKSKDMKRFREYWEPYKEWIDNPSVGDKWDYTWGKGCLYGLSHNMVIDLPMRYFASFLAVANQLKYEVVLLVMDSINRTSDGKTAQKVIDLVEDLKGTVAANQLTILKRGLLYKDSPLAKNAVFMNALNQNKVVRFVQDQTAHDIHVDPLPTCPDGQRWDGEACVKKEESDTTMVLIVLVCIALLGGILMYKNKFFSSNK